MAIPVKTRKQKAITYVLGMIRNNKDRQSILDVLVNKFEYAKNGVSTIHQNIKNGKPGWTE